MAWIIRLLGVVLAVTATAAVMVALPIADHHGITPIHTTRIDGALFAVGYFLLFSAITLVIAEGAITMLQRPLIARSDARIPVARVVR